MIDWYPNDLAPSVDIIEALRSVKLFQHRIIGEALSGEVTTHAVYIQDQLSSN